MTIDGKQETNMAHASETRRSHIRDAESGARKSVEIAEQTGDAA